MDPLSTCIAVLLATAATVAQQQQQIHITLDDSANGRIPAIRRTDPRDEPALVKLVEQKAPGAMSALFSLGYLRDPQPRTRDLLRESARSSEVLTAYPAVVSLWRIDDPEWKSIANAALPRLTVTQQMHVASLLFRAGDYRAWGPAMRTRMLDMLASPAEQVRNDALGLLSAIWDMTDEASPSPGEPGAAVRELRKLAAAERVDATERERILKTLEDFRPGSVSGSIVQ